MVDHDMQDEQEQQPGDSEIRVAMMMPPTMLLAVAFFAAAGLQIHEAGGALPTDDGGPDYEPAALAQMAGEVRQFLGGVDQSMGALAEAQQQLLQQERDRQEAAAPFSSPRPRIVS